MNEIENFFKEDEKGPDVPDVTNIMQDKLLKVQDEMRKKLRDIDISLKNELNEVKRSTQDRDPILKREITNEIFDHIT
jgi:hypothetical protein